MEAGPQAPGESVELVTEATSCLLSCWAEVGREPEGQGLAFADSNCMLTLFADDKAKARGLGP